MGWRYRLDLEYDGAGFAGWQVQPDRRTVQGILTGALGRLGIRARPTGAGRTDAGVHALANVAHVDLDREWDAQDLERALGALCPEDVRVLAVARVDPEFHARFDAESRTYHYAFAGAVDPFFRGRRWSPRRLPDPDWAAGELAGLVGERDCTSLARAGAETTSMVCVIEAGRWLVRDEGAMLVVTANRFLWGMVRTLAGTLIAGWDRGEKEGHLARVMERHGRDAAAPPAPPEGLYLTEVRYRGEEPTDRAERVAVLAGLGSATDAKEMGR
jgi:tRNA pseudouridine38-40 synthase